MLHLDEALEPVHRGLVFLLGLRTAVLLYPFPGEGEELNIRHDVLAHNLLPDSLHVHVDQCQVKGLNPVLILADEILALCDDGGILDLE